MPDEADPRAEFRLRARGKGKARTFVPMQAALPSFDLLWQFSEAAIGDGPGDLAPVFATVTGKRLASVKKSLHELLKAARLLTDHCGMRRTSYSFRQFYIRQQLIAGVDVFLLARIPVPAPT